MSSRSAGTPTGGGWERYVHPDGEWCSWWHEASAVPGSGNVDLYIRRKRCGPYLLQTEADDTDTGVPDIFYGKYRTLKAAKIAWLVIRGTG